MDQPGEVGLSHGFSRGGLGAGGWIASFGGAQSVCISRPDGLGTRAERPLMPWPIDEDRDGVRFLIKVHPNAGRTEIAGILGRAVKIKLNKPAVEGAANKECVRFLAGKLEVPPSRIFFLKGGFSREKVVRVSGITAAEACRRLGPAPM